MPLQLGGVETARAQTITWDRTSMDQMIDAQKTIEMLQRQGFILDHEEAGEARLVPPDRNPNIGCFRILSDNGDDRVIWDRRIPEQVKDAFKKFKELLKKGFTAYATTSDGSRGHKITEFDPGLEEIILGAGEAIFVPKTKPG
jgi:hypothetical protein